MPVPSVQWINSWRWAEELPETCKVSCWSKFGKLVHLVGFIIKKFITMHGHVNLKALFFCFTLLNKITGLFYTKYKKKTSLFSIKQLKVSNY
jgi:hypothetical protein